MSTSVNEKAGQSGGKSVKSWSYFPPPSGGATGTVVHRLDATRKLPELRKPGIPLSRPIRPVRPKPKSLFKKRQNSEHYTILLSELALPSTRSPWWERHRPRKLYGVNIVTSNPVSGK